MHEVKVLPLVKAYPNLSRKYGEVSCIAGLDQDTGKMDSALSGAI
jgi:hypothetical protein